MEASSSVVLNGVKNCYGQHLFSFFIDLNSDLTPGYQHSPLLKTYEPWHEISNNVVCTTSKGSDQPAHMRSLIKAFASRLNIL